MKLRIGLALVWALVSTSVCADNLLQIYELARQADAQWLAARAANKAAQEATEQSFAAFLPSVGLAADSTINDQDRETFSSSSSDRFNSNAWTLSATQPVFRMGNYAAHRQAKASVRQADSLLAAEEQNLIVRVAQAYFEVLTAEAELFSVEANSKAIERQLEQAKKRYEVGLIAITDVHEAQAEYDLSKATEIRAANAVEIAFEALREITGQSHSELSKLAAEIPMITPDPASVDAWVEKARQDNLSIAASLAAIEVSQENVNLQQAGHYPTLDLVGTTGDRVTHGGISESEIDSSTISLQFNLPIYQGGAVSSRTRQALAQLEQAREEATGTHRAVEKQARSAYLGVMADLSRIKALQQSVVSSQSAVDATEAGFEVGTRTIVDVLDAQRGLYRAKADYHIARYAYIVNYFLLKEAAGNLSAGDVTTVNSVLTEKEFMEPVKQ